MTRLLECAQVVNAQAVPSPTRNFPFVPDPSREPRFAQRSRAKPRIVFQFKKNIFVLALFFHWLEKRPMASFHTLFFLCRNVPLKKQTQNSSTTTHTHTKGFQIKIPRRVPMKNTLDFFLVCAWLYRCIS